MQLAAAPSLVQLVMRFALAVPFWKSGILKWSGPFQLSDTAVALFTDEFMLHLPGGPYHYPVPSLMAFLSGCGAIAFESAFCQLEQERLGCGNLARRSTFADCHRLA